MTDTQSYETVRRTTVRRLAPKAMPRRGAGGHFLPKSGLAKPDLAKPVESPMNKPSIIVRFEIIGNAQRTAELVLCEGIMPRQLAETLKRFAEAWYIS